jgi:hypothetical protein
MNVGDTIEAALWYNPAQPADKDKARDGIAEQMASVAVLAPIEWEDLPAGDERLPPAPFEGARCMVGRARVCALRREGRFVDDLEKKDLEMLRDATRRQLPHRTLSDAECDDIIDEVGIETVLKQLNVH